MIVHRLLTALAPLGVGLIVVGALLGGSPAAMASAGSANMTMNFQGRLLSNAGAVVADGTYNMEFKIYKDGDGLNAGDGTGTPGGTLLWTEDWVGNAGHGVTVKNGYFSVQLGSVTPLPSTLSLDESALWLSMNVAQTTGSSCTPFSSCTPDGEMTPMRAIGSSPFALNAASANSVLSYGNNNKLLNLAVPSGVGSALASGGSLTVAQAYYYVVTATNAQGETLASSSTTKTPTSGNQTVNLSWTEVPGATGYKIYRNTTNSFTSGSLLLATVTSGSVVTYPDTGSATAAGLPPTSTTGTTLTIQGWQSQTANLLQLQNSASTNVLSVDGSGNGTFTGALVSVGVNSGTGQIQGTGGLNVTGATTINMTGTGATTIGSGSAGAISIQGGSAGTTVNDTSGSLTLSTTTSGALSVTSAGTLTLQGAGTTALQSAATSSGSTNSASVSLLSGNATGTTSSSGSIFVNVGTATSTTGSINIGTTNVASSIAIGTATGAESITLGSTNSTSVANIYGGVNGTNATVSVQTATSGYIAIGTTNAGVLQLGAIGSTANADTVHLADSTGAAQTVTIGSTASSSKTTLQGGTGNINLNVNQAGYGTVVQSVTNNSTGAFQVQDAGGFGVLTVDTSSGSGNGQVLLGLASHNNGTLVFANSAGSTQIALAVTSSNATGYTLDLPTAAPGSTQCLGTGTGGTTDQLTWTTCGGSGGGGNKSLDLVPEFAGAVFSPVTGSNNTGYMQSDTDGVHNFYEWSTTQTGAQSYDVIAKIRLPSDWTGWNSFWTMYVYSDYLDGLSSGSATTVTYKLTDINSGGTATDCYGAGTYQTALNGNGTAAAWTQVTLATPTATQCTTGMAAGDWLRFDIRLTNFYHSTTNWIKVGELSAKYQ